MITFNEYLEKVYKNFAHYDKFRYGQILYNTLFELEPELANEILKTDIDPYHTNKPEVCEKFFAWLIKTLPSPVDSGARSSKPS